MCSGLCENTDLCNSTGVHCSDKNSLILIRSLLLLAKVANTAPIAFFPSASAKVVITTDQGIRGGKIIPLKETVDKAVQDCDCVEKVFVSQRTGANVPMTKRDIPLQEVAI